MNSNKVGCFIGLKCLVRVAQCYCVRIPINLRFEIGDIFFKGHRSLYARYSSKAAIKSELVMEIERLFHQNFVPIASSTEGGRLVNWDSNSVPGFKLLTGKRAHFLKQTHPKSTQLQNNCLSMETSSKTAPIKIYFRVTQSYSQNHFLCNIWNHLIKLFRYIRTPMERYCSKSGLEIAECKSQFNFASAL